MSDSSNHTVHVSARWYRNKVSAIETMTIELPATLAAMVDARQMENTHSLRNARVTGEDRIHLHGCLTSQDDARQCILRARRAIRFLCATGLRSATTAERECLEKRLQGLPGTRVNSSAWINIDSGAWVFADSTRDPVTDARATWARKNGVAHIAPGWENVWPPGVTIPHLFCADAATSAALSARLGEIHADGPMIWNGTSTPYIKPVKVAPMKRSRAPTMSLEQHLEVGPKLAALCASRLPRLVAKEIGDVRYELGELMPAEHSGQKCGPVYYSHGKPLLTIDDRAEQLAAIDQVVAIMASIYSSRGVLLVALRKARTRLWLSPTRRMARAPTAKQLAA